MSTLKLLREIRKSGDKTPYSTLLKNSRKFEDGGNRKVPSLPTMQQFSSYQDNTYVQPVTNPIESQAISQQAQIKRDNIERMKPPTSLVPESERLMTNIKGLGNVVGETIKPLLEAGSVAAASAMAAPQAITLGAEGILPALDIAGKGIAGATAMDYLYGKVGGQLPGDILNLQNPVNRYIANTLSPGLLAGTNVASSYYRFKPKYKIINKVEDPIEYNLEHLNLPKLEYNDKSLNKFIKKYENNLKKLEKEKDNALFNSYIDEIISHKITPENLEKAKKWDDKYGSEIYNNLQQLDNFQADIIGKRYPFEVDVFTRQPKGRPFKIAGYAGYKKLPAEEALKRRTGFDIKTNEYYFSENFNDYRISDRILGIRKSSINNPSNAKRVIEHELGHITEGSYKNWPEAMQKRFLDIMKPQEELVDNLMMEANLKNKDIDWLNKKTNLIEYYTTPTEISQHGITNMRQELIDKNIIPDMNAIISPEHISQLFKLQESKTKMNYVAKGFFQHVDKSKTKEIANLMNEYPKTIISGAIGAKMLTEYNKTK